MFLHRWDLYTPTRLENMEPDPLQAPQFAPGTRLQDRGLGTLQFASAHGTGALPSPALENGSWRSSPPNPDVASALPNTCLQATGFYTEPAAVPVLGSARMERKRTAVEQTLTVGRFGASLSSQHTCHHIPGEALGWRGWCWETGVGSAWAPFPTGGAQGMLPFERGQRGRTGPSHSASAGPMAAQDGRPGLLPAACSTPRGNC